MKISKYKKVKTETPFDFLIYITHNNKKGTDRYQINKKALPWPYLRHGVSNRMFVSKLLRSVG